MATHPDCDAASTVGTAKYEIGDLICQIDDLLLERQSHALEYDVRARIVTRLSLQRRTTDNLDDLDTKIDTAKKACAESFAVIKRIDNTVSQHRVRINALKTIVRTFKSEELEREVAKEIDQVKISV